MAAAESSRKSFIVRLSLPKRKAVAPPPLSHHHHHVEKRMKFHDSNYSKTTTSTLVKNKIQERVQQQQQQLVDEKRRKVTVPVEKDSRKSRNPSPPPPLVKERSYRIVDSRKRKNDGTMECNKEEKKMMMDRGKKNQCWVIVKRMIVGKHGRVLKKSLNLKGLAYYDQIKEEFKITTMRTIGLEDIEVKLSKWLYSVPEEFADDMRLVFSRAFLYPPRSQVHRIAKRLSDSFEISWKSLKEKWTLEDRESKKRVPK